MTFTAEELRQLRYRMGWSQAELARCLNTNLDSIASWETGVVSPAQEYRHALLRIFTEAEMNADRMQRRPVAEALMKTRRLSQIHDSEVVESLEKADGQGSTSAP